MDLYVILRRNGWRDGADLEAAAARSTAEGDKDGSGVQWIRSYVLQEEAADLPADEIIPVADTVIVRPDPSPVGS